MSEACQETLRCSPEDLNEALAIHTQKITDSCRDKDCIEDLRVYLTSDSQAVLDGAAGAKVRCADLLCAYIDVEPVAFDSNRYCVDVTFYYRVLADALVSGCRPTALNGLAVFSKRVVLCGEDSKVHVFSSDGDGLSCCGKTKPTAVVEVLDPMVLSSKVKEVCECDCGCKETTTVQIPCAISEMFDGELVLAGENRRLFVTLGQFSLIRLERDAQLVVPVLRYSLPTKECGDSCGCAEDPCEMFSRIPFPVSQFNPTGCDRDSDDNGHTGYTTTGK